MFQLGSLVLSLTLLFSGFLALLYAAGKLATRSVGYEARLMAAAYFAISTMLCHGAALVSGAMVHAPHWLGWYLPGLLSIGPLVLQFVRVRLQLRAGKLPWWWHLGPAALTIPILFSFLTVDSGTKLGLIESARTGNVELSSLLIVSVTSLHPIAYAVFGAIELIRATGWPLPSGEKPVKLIYALLLALGLVSIILFTGFIAESSLLLSSGAICGAMFIPALYIIGRRYPQFFDDMQLIVERGKYQNSQLRGKDLEEIGRKLHELMTLEELYKDESLSLASLAAWVKLSPHQLSEYFNVQLKVNFSRYVNRYRIQEACKMLNEQPDVTVLNVAFAVGFNSKSVFNAAFSRETGQTPTQYRARPSISDT